MFDKKFGVMLESALEQAELVLAVKAITDELQSMAEKISKMQVEDVASIAERIKAEQGVEAGAEFQNSVNQILQTTLTALQTSKSSVDNEALFLSGDAQKTPMMPADGMNQDETLGQDGLDGGEEDMFAGHEANAGEEEEPVGRVKKESIQATKKALVEGAQSLKKSIVGHEKAIERLEKQIADAGGKRNVNVEAKHAVQKHKEELKKDKEKLKELAESARSLDSNSKKKLVNEGISDIAKEVRNVLRNAGFDVSYTDRNSNGWSLKLGRGYKPAVIKKAKEVEKILSNYDVDVKIVGYDPNLNIYSLRVFVPNDMEKDVSEAINEEFEDSYTKYTNPSMNHIGDAYDTEIKNQTTKAYDVAREAELVAVGRLEKTPEEMKGLRNEICDEIENVAKNLAILHPSDYGKIVALSGIAKVLIRAKRKLDDVIHETAVAKMSGMVESLKARGLTESETYKKSVAILEKWKDAKGTNPAKKGMWDGWTKAELEAERTKLKKKENHTAAETTKLKEIDFALRAKNKWGKVEESNLNEAASRKDFQMVANLLKKIPDIKKRKQLAQHHADIFKKQNPRFSHGKFYTAVGVDGGDNGKQNLVKEESVNEAMSTGNSYSANVTHKNANGDKEYNVKMTFKATSQEDFKKKVKSDLSKKGFKLIRIWGITSQKKK